MRNLLLNAVCTTSLALWIGTASIMAAESLTGTENPDPSHIKGASDDATITLTPRDDIEDHRNLQWALDNAAPGGTVKLEAGTFFMGDGKTALRKTAWVRRGSWIAAARSGPRHWSYSCFWPAWEISGDNVISETRATVPTLAIRMCTSIPRRTICDW